MNLTDMANEMRRLSTLLDQGITALREQARELAEAEHDYRLLKAQAFVSAPDGTVPEKEAWVNGRCAEARRRRDLAEGLRVAALEAVRSRRTQISACQSMLNAHQAEAEFARTGPRDEQFGQGRAA